MNETKILTELINRKIHCTIFTINGFQLRGRVIAADEKMICVEVDGKQNLVYKHAISTIAPALNLNNI